MNASPCKIVVRIGCRCAVHARLMDNNHCLCINKCKDYYIYDSNKNIMSLCTLSTAFSLLAGSLVNIRSYHSTEGIFFLKSRLIQYLISSSLVFLYCLQHNHYGSCSPDEGMPKVQTWLYSSSPLSLSVIRQSSESVVPAGNQRNTSQEFIRTFVRLPIWQYSAATSGPTAGLA